MARSSDATSGWVLTSTAALPLTTAAVGNLGPFTIVFWFKSHDTSQTNRYLHSMNSVPSGTQYAVIYGFASQQIEFYDPGFTGTDPRTNSGITIGDTNWHHVAYRYNGAGSTWDKFLDGTKTSINATITFTVPSLGIGDTPRWALFGFWNGSSTSAEASVEMQEVAYLPSTALSDGNISNLANGSVSLATLVGATDPYWPLCGTASPEPDLSSNAWDLTVSGPVFATGPAGIASPCNVAGQPTMRRWGGTPFMGGQGIGQKGSAGGSGRAWGKVA